MLVITQCLDREMIILELFSLSVLDKKIECPKPTSRVIIEGNLQKVDSKGKVEVYELQRGGVVGEACSVGQVSGSLSNNYSMGFACGETEQVSTLHLGLCPPMGLRWFERVSGVLPPHFLSSVQCSLNKGLGILGMYGIIFLLCF